MTHSIPGQEEWAARYKAMLLEDVIAFWSRHGPDREHGGMLTYLDRGGIRLSTDKAIWLQGRATWMYAQLYTRVEPNPEWLEISNLCRDFLLRHGFDAEGRMFFAVTREGRPLRKRRYLFSEIFAIMGFAANAVANSSFGLLERAYRLLERVYRLSLNPDHTMPPKIIPETRRMRSHALPMVLICTAQEVRAALRVLGGPGEWIEKCNRIISSSAAEIRDLHWKREYDAVLERVEPDGSIIDVPEGRIVTPGHGMETSWFLLEEAAERGDAEMKEFALKVLRSALRIGWDDAHGGLFYFADVKGLPPDPIEYDMKLWWPHAEAIYATLLGYRHSGDPALLAWHERIRDWSLARFPDTEHGEWYGYLRRDGSVSKPIKGNFWKGPFHLPRALLRCWKCLE
jgi:N-acylglucosamine 2-epimerase